MIDGKIFLIRDEARKPLVYGKDNQKLIYNKTVSMFNSIQTINSKAIALGLILGSIFIPAPLWADTPDGARLSDLSSSSRDRFLEDIQVGENLNWNFSSEDETRSIEDELKKVSELNLSQSESDVRIIEEDQKWGNRGDVEDYKFKIDVYEY